MNGDKSFKPVRNCEAAPLSGIPLLDIDSFRDAVMAEVAAGARISALFGAPCPGDGTRIFAVLASDIDGRLLLSSSKVWDRYPALTPECPQAHWFEREIAEQWGIVPQGHPWFKPLRFHKSYAKGRDAWGRHESSILPSVTDYFKVEGEGVHEVAVGPVHAGVIEPGHFRFQCDGERVFNLEISLGYQHRGIERAFMARGADARTLHMMETLSGDSTVAHTTAHCHAVEALTGTDVSLRAQAIRAIALELERMANHTGDLGALAGDVAYLPTSSYCGRIRGEYLNMSAEICGNRFGRNLVRPGGVAFDIGEARAAKLASWLEKVFAETENAVSLLWKTPSVVERFEETGKLSLDTCEDIGLVGVAARACGVERDIRYDFPSGVYRFNQLPVSTYTGGDVFARAQVRWLELKQSAAYVKALLSALPAGETSCALAGPPPPDSIAVSLVEGWRGEICHAALTGRDGRISRYKVVDPSFHNWFGLSMALRGEQISNFPLCNKSFNLSYCGHDL